jgi:hypothetical protein
MNNQSDSPIGAFVLLAVISAAVGAFGYGVFRVKQDEYNAQHSIQRFDTPDATYNGKPYRSAYNS